MKNALVALAALALLVGCSSPEETVHVDVGAKSGEGPAPAGDNQPGGADVLTGANEEPTVPSATDNPLGTAKPDEPKAGEPAKTDAPAEPGKFATKDFFGTYDGKLDAPPEFYEQIKAMVPPEQQAEVEKQFKSIAFTLELKSGDRYAQTTSGGGQSRTENGKWTYDKAKNVVTLYSPEITAEQRAQLKQGGRTDAEIDAKLKESQDAAVSKDGRTLVMQRTEMGFNFKMTFTKR
jgi:hypothetical protein